MDNIGSYITGPIVDLAFTFVFLIVSWGVTEAARYIKTKNGNEKLDNALARLCHMVETTVSEYNQAVVDRLKGQGVFDGQRQEEIKKEVIAKVMDRAGFEVIRTAQAGGIYKLYEWLGARVERSVREQKLFITPPNCD
jgi:hypothetical protein